MSEEELREFVNAEHQCMIDELGEGLDVEAEIKKLLDRKAIYDKDHDVTFRLRGRQLDRAVWLNDKQLSPKASQTIKNHSPDGFNWDNYGGSGPAQLALAVCLELFGPDKALELYQKFKWDIISHIPGSDFDIMVHVVTRNNDIYAKVLL